MIHKKVSKGYALLQIKEIGVWFKLNLYITNVIKFELKIYKKIKRKIKDHRTFN